MDIYRQCIESEASMLSNYCLQANTDYSKYLSFYVTVALDQRKQKYTEFLKESVLIVC